MDIASRISVITELINKIINAKTSCIFWLMVNIRLLHEQFTIVSSSENLVRKYKHALFTLTDVLNTLLNLMMQQRTPVGSV